MNDIIEKTAPTWTPEEIELIRNTVAPGATPEELKLFLYTASARGLNPLLKQIYFIKRKQKRGDRWVDIGTIQTGVDGFRVIANRTGLLAGVERGVRRDADNKLYAWARVWRKDWDKPAYEEASLEEYRGDGPLWTKMPEQMLKKAVECLALRIAFPEDMSGLYGDEEMSQADAVEQGPPEPRRFTPAVPDPKESVAALDRQIEATKAKVVHARNQIRKLVLDNSGKITKITFKEATNLDMDDIAKIEDPLTLTTILSDLEHWVNGPGGAQ